jgi:glucan phosphoethanolaminetransferase (alkaline phosphatase superfamily)
MVSYDKSPMPVHYFFSFLTYVWMFSPLLLFCLAWCRHYQHLSRTLLLPTLSALLLVAAVVRNLKVLLGSDYSHRLYISIEVNMFLGVAAAIYFLWKKRWTPAVAALILALDWLFLGAINSVV